MSDAHEQARRRIWIDAREAQDVRVGVGDVHEAECSACRAFVRSAEFYWSLNRHRRRGRTLRTILGLGASAGLVTLGLVRHDGWLVGLGSAIFLILVPGSVVANAINEDTRIPGDLVSDPIRFAHRRLGRVVLELGVDITLGGTIALAGVLTTGLGWTGLGLVVIGVALALHDWQQLKRTRRFLRDPARGDAAIVRR